MCEVYKQWYVKRTYVFLILSALSTGGYAGQIQGAYGKRCKDGAVSEPTLFGPEGAIYSNKHQEEKVENTKTVKAYTRSQFTSDYISG